MTLINNGQWERWWERFFDLSYPSLPPLLQEAMGRRLKKATSVCVVCILLDGTIQVAQSTESKRARHQQSPRPVGRLSFTLEVQESEWNSQGLQRFVCHGMIQTPILTSATPNAEALSQPVESISLLQTMDNRQRPFCRAALPSGSQSRQNSRTLATCVRRWQ